VTAIQTARETICYLDMRGDERGTILAMKILSYLTKASIEAARLMILAAPEGTLAEGLTDAISVATKHAEWLEIAAIDRQAALEDRKS
jgi:hypothetical protein